MTTTDTRRYTLAVVTAGVGEPSTTRMLADRIVQRVVDAAGRRGGQVTVQVLDLRELATEITTAMVAQLTGPKLRQAVTSLAAADALVACTPIYKAGASGLFTSFFQILDNDLLIGKPVVLAATAGTARHALVVDEQIRSMFAFLRTLPVPTSLFAAPEDWRDPELTTRIDRAAQELALLLETSFAAQLRAESWHGYQHEFGSASTPDPTIDLDTDLMRLATGGTAP